MNIVSQYILRYSGNKISGTILFFYFLWVGTLVIRSHRGLDDFDVYFHAGKRLLLNQDIYGQPYYNQLRFYYSPLFAWLLSPFTGFPVNYVKITWFFLNYILLIRSVFILKQFTDWNFKGSAWVLLGLCLCSGKIMMHNFLANQLSILILWTLLESFRQYTLKNSIWSILIFCIGLNFKVMSVIVLPYYFLVGRMRYKFLFPLISIILLIVPSLGLNWNYNSFLLAKWWQGINPADRFHVVQTSEAGFLDLGSLITKYFTNGEIINEYAVNILDLGYVPILFITNILRLVLLSITVYVVRHIKGQLPGINRDLASIVPFIALIPILLPHQRDYSFLLVMPMLLVLVLIISRLKQKKWLILLFFFICLSGFLSWSTLIGKGLVDIFMFTGS